MSGGPERPHPRRLMAETYPFVSAISARYADLDPNRHVNNVAIAAYCEEARAQLLYELRARCGSEHPPAWMVAELRIRYLAQILYPATITVGSGLLHLGRSSIVIGQGLFVNGSCVALCDTVGVYSDGSRSAPIPDAWRAVFSAVLLDLPAP